MTPDQKLELEDAMREAAKDFDAGTVTEILDTDDDQLIDEALDLIAESTITIQLGGTR